MSKIEYGSKEYDQLTRDFATGKISFDEFIEAQHWEEQKCVPWYREASAAAFVLFIGLAYFIDGWFKKVR